MGRALAIKQVPTGAGPVVSIRCFPATGAVLRTKSGAAQLGGGVECEACATSCKLEARAGWIGSPLIRFQLGFGTHLGVCIGSGLHLTS